MNTPDTPLPNEPRDSSVGVAATSSDPVQVKASTTSKKGLRRFASPSSRGYWLATGLLWGAAAGASACLVVQAYVFNISAANNAAETRAIVSGLNKASLLLKMATEGRTGIWIDDRGREVFISAGSDQPAYLLSESEKVLYRWGNKPAAARNTMDLLSAINTDSQAGVRPIAPLATAMFAAASARERANNQDRWIDDPIVLSLLTQTLTREYLAQESRINKLTLWPMVARCLAKPWAPCERSHESLGVRPEETTPAATPPPAPVPHVKPSAEASEVSGL